MPKYERRGEVFETPSRFTGDIEEDSNIIVASLINGTVNDANAEGETLLMQAAKMKRGDLINSLLDFGADPNLADRNGFRALNYTSPEDACAVRLEEVTVPSPSTCAEIAYNFLDSVVRFCLGR